VYRCSIGTLRDPAVDASYDTQDQASHIAVYSNTLLYRFFADTALFYSGDVVEAGSVMKKKKCNDPLKLDIEI